MILDLNDIKKLIPHRHPFLFIDSCQIHEIGSKGSGLKTFKINEYFFEGHFPNMPIVPGVVLIEAMAQTAGVVVSKKYQNFPNKTVLFMSVSKAKFRKPAFPDDEIIFNVKILHKVKNVYKFLGHAFKKDQKICEAEFSAMISFS
jgi:3-hydroxyacyl-[acyl-carrier-protein] dehydratase